jgi:hypothetical protein
MNYKKGEVAPPKLPETTNLVLTKSKNEYNEMRQMNVNVIIENKRPPLKKLKNFVRTMVKYERMQHTPFQGIAHRFQ